MAEARVVVRTGVGLHAGPAAALVAEARRHACAVTFACGARAANAKSILDVLALGVRDGEELLVRAEGEGAGDAVGALARVLGEQRGRL